MQQHNVRTVKAIRDSYTTCHLQMTQPHLVYNSDVLPLSPVWRPKLSPLVDMGRE